MTEDGYDYQQLKHRDKHDGGVTWDKLKVTHARTKLTRVRSRQDVRLFKAMDPMQEAAFTAIQTAHGILTAGLGMKGMSFDLGGKGTGDIESGALLLAKYNRWRDECKRQYISPLMAQDIIVEGMSFMASDRLRQMRNGTSKENLLKCLSVWAKC